MKHKLSIFERILCCLCIAALLFSTVGCGKQANCVNGHSYEKESEQMPSCTETGTAVYICSVCGDRMTEILQATGHETGDWIVGIDGTHYHICAVCGEKIDVAIHDYDGTTHRCTFCGAYDPAAVLKVEKPTAGITKRAYTGSSVLYLPDGYDEETMSISGNIQTGIGEYTVMVSLKDPEHSVWSDGSTAPLTFVFVVIDEKITVPVPTASTFVYVYNGAVLSYRPVGFNASLMSAENGDQINAGSYTVSVSLLDTEHYLWEDGTVEQKSFVFIIEKCPLIKPTTGETVYRYTGQDILFLPEGFDPSTMSVSGNEQILAGNYKAVVSLLDGRNYSWTDGTTDTVELFWTVEKALITKPTSDNNICVYTGESVTFRPNGFNSATMVISNNTATALGSYKATVSLKDSENCIWTDGTDGSFEIPFTIEEKNLPYTINKTSDTVLEILYVEKSTVYKSFVSYPAGSSFRLDQDTGVLTFSFEGAVDEGLSYSFSGTYYGSLFLEVGEENELTLNLEGFSLIGKNDCPLFVSSAKNVDISAKNGTENDILDARNETEERKSAVYAACNLKLKGSGTLSVVSENNNGIHSKDNLEVQKLTLYVKCVDNALKGNDKVRISSGTLTLIARKGDGIKTSNTALSSKGNQKGSVSVEGGVLNIYAACDGIDAAFDALVTGGTVNIYTDKYSEYSETVTVSTTDEFYIRSLTTAYKYSAYFFNTETDGVWVNFSETPKKVSSGFRTYYFYQTERPTGYSYVRIYVYSSNQSQGQEDSFYRVSEKMTLTTNYDTVAFGSSKGNKPGMGTAEAFSWTNYSSSSQGDGFGGNDGNKDKGTYSTKGIKAGNSIEISGGALTVCSYDDALHAGTDKAMESGAIPVGDVTVSGGTLTLSSNDDAIHADGKATVLDGSIRVLKSYEGIEGQTVEIAGGDVSVISSDDGLNGTATSGTSITVSGGKLYVLAGGDGVDANSQTAYGGILFSGGYSVIISTGKADSSIDSERGYKYSGGYVLGIGLSGGMGSESANCQNLSSYGKTTTLSLSQGSYLTVSGMASVKIPTSMSALVVVLGSTSASVSSASSGFGTADINGVCWLVKEK